MSREWCSSWYPERPSAAFVALVAATVWRTSCAVECAKNVKGTRCFVPPLHLQMNATWDPRLVVGNTSDKGSTNPILKLG